VTTDARNPGGGLAQLLATTQETGSSLISLPPEFVPVDAAAAFAVQHRTLASRDKAIGGFKSPVTNPAEDPRRLLAWVVNHCTARGISVGVDVVMTIGRAPECTLRPRPGRSLAKFEAFQRSA
jgi:hypothetical protein